MNTKRYFYYLAESCIFRIWLWFKSGTTYSFLFHLTAVKWGLVGGYLGVAWGLVGGSVRSGPRNPQVIPSAVSPISLYTLDRWKMRPV